MEGDGDGDVGGFGPHRGAEHSTEFYFKGGVVGFGTGEVHVWVYDSNKPLCGFCGKRYCPGEKWMLGRAASRGDGGAWTRVGPRVQGSGCTARMFRRWS